MMKIGFIGVGTIAGAMIDGLMKIGFAVDEIIISPRNKDHAEALAAKYDKVKIAADNQAVADATSHVFLCLRSQTAEPVLRALKFRPEQEVVSVLAMASGADVEGWIGHKVYRAVPLPFVAECKGLTPVFPESPFLHDMFSALGGVLAVEKEEDFNLFMTAGSFMGAYYRFMDVTGQWLINKGMAAETAKAYLANVYGNLADEMRKTKAPDFKALEREYSTAGGTNEIIAHAFAAQGGEKALLNAIDEGYKKITG